MNTSEVQNQIISVYQDGANWAVSVSLGMGAMLCVAFLVGFVLRKL